MANKSDRYQILVLIKVYLKNNVKKYLMSNQTSYNNKRIAKNTLLLYVRMLFMMLIGLYTSRVILQSLGVESYGINNVIAGFLSMFGIITSSMSSAISRFITVELGKGNLNRLKLVFSTSISVQLFMGILLVLLIETIGMWFVNTKMQIPQGGVRGRCAMVFAFLLLIEIKLSF